MASAKLERQLRPAKLKKAEIACKYVLWVYYVQTTWYDKIGFNFNHVLLSIQCGSHDVFLSIPRYHIHMYLRSMGPPPPKKKRGAQANFEGGTGINLWDNTGYGQHDLYPQNGLLLRCILFLKSVPFPLTIHIKESISSPRSFGFVNGSCSWTNFSRGSSERE